MALDTLSRLSREFASKPDCSRLINLVLLSLTGQFSAVGAFASFIPDKDTPKRPMFRGSGLLYDHTELEQLLQNDDNRSFFMTQTRPLRTSELSAIPSVPEQLIPLLADSGVAVAIPLVLHDTLIGLLGLAFKVDRKDFCDADVSLMSTLADTIAPLMNTMLLYSRLNTLNQWHRDVIDSVRQGVLIFSYNLELKQANSRAQELFSSLGRQLDDGRRQLSASELFDYNTFPGWSTFVVVTVGGNEIQASENLIVRTGDTERIYMVRVSRTSGAEENLSDIIVTFDEVTEQRANERRLFEMEKFAEKGVMAASIAHELNNHLALILGGIELAEIASRRDDIQKTRESLEKLKKHSLTMERYTAGLTDYSKLESEKKAADLNVIVKDVVSFARVQKRFSGLTLKTQLASGMPTAILDVDQMAQLLMNLLNNAADAIKDAGREQGIVQVTTDFDDSSVFLRVADNGTGIPDELKAKLFKTGFTTKEYGHGFGMVTCGRILERHGAHHAVDSELSKGTSITVVFPLTQQHTPVLL